MKTIWIRPCIGGKRYPRSTGCRDVRNAEAAARKIRAEIEAEVRGIAPPKRITIEDALKDFVRSLASGRGGADQQKAVEKIVKQVLAAGPVRFVDELHVGIYDAWVAKARQPRPKKPNGLAKWTIHMRAQYIRRFGKWLEDTDRIHKSPFRTVPLISGATSAKRKRALKFDELNTLLTATRRRPIDDARRERIHAGVSDRERVRLRKVGRRRALVMRTIARSGIRPNELRQVTIAYFDPADQTIFLPAHVAKAKRDELVYLTPDLSRRLAALVRSMGPGPDSRRLFPKAIPNSRTFDLDMAAAGLPKEDLRRGSLCLYSMRKTFSTHLSMCGVDDEMGSRLMRHALKSLKARVYTDAGLLDLREPMRLLDQRDREERRKWRRGL
ncbi:MAG: tyrosine-type recombinase/integrase [Planctomycetes bacterium]|nr:tyrosine-type recombinase/integrase [Planctomycetota bacterium]